MTWVRNSGFKQPYFCGERWKQSIWVFWFSFNIPINTSVANSPLSLQLCAVEYPPWPACECVKCVAVFAVIHQVSNYVGGCYCQLCWASPAQPGDREMQDCEKTDQVWSVANTGHCQTRARHLHRPHCENLGSACTMGPKRKQLYGNQLCPSCSSGCSNQANNQVWMRALWKYRAANNLSVFTFLTRAFTWLKALLALSHLRHY